MKTVRMIFLITISFICLLQVNGQSFKAVYEYDANGNRIKTTTIYLSKSNTAQSANDDLTVNSESVLKLTIYPNPTSEVLYIDLTGVEQEKLGSAGNSIKVWDLQGRLVQEHNQLKVKNTLNFTGLSNGIYIVTLVYDGKKMQYKVIKS